MQLYLTDVYFVVDLSSKTPLPSVTQLGSMLHQNTNQYSLLYKRPIYIYLLIETELLKYRGKVIYIYIFYIYLIYMQKQEMRKILVILPKKDIEAIEKEIAAGRYVTKSDFFRMAVKRLLYSEERLTRFEAIRAELQKDLKKKKVSRSKLLKDLMEAKDDTAAQVAALLSQ